jgi:hypothetical protein
MIEMNLNLFRAICGPSKAESQAECQSESKTGPGQSLSGKMLGGHRRGCRARSPSHESAESRASGPVTQAQTRRQVELGLRVTGSQCSELLNPTRRHCPAAAA